MALIDQIVLHPSYSGLAKTLFTSTAFTYGPVGALQEEGTSRLGAVARIALTTILLSLSLEILPTQPLEGRRFAHMVSYMPLVTIPVAIFSAFFWIRGSSYAKNIGCWTLRSLELAALTHTLAIAILTPTPLALGAATFTLLHALTAHNMLPTFLTSPLSTITAKTAQVVAAITLLFTLKQAVLSFPLKYFLLGVVSVLGMIYLRGQRALTSSKMRETSADDHFKNLITLYGEKLPHAFKEVATEQAKWVHGLEPQALHNLSEMWKDHVNNPHLEAVDLPIKIAVETIARTFKASPAAEETLYQELLFFLFAPAASHTHEPPEPPNYSPIRGTRFLFDLINPASPSRCFQRVHNVAVQQLLSSLTPERILTIKEALGRGATDETGALTESGESAVRFLLAARARPALP